MSETRTETDEQPFPTRGDNFLTLGRLESDLGLAPRKDEDFTRHADHQNYLQGRKQAKDTPVQ